MKDWHCKTDVPYFKDKLCSCPYYLFWRIPALLQEVSEALVEADTPGLAGHGSLHVRLQFSSWRVATQRSQIAWYTDKKFKFSFIYKEIQNGAVAKSYMRKGFLIYDEEMRKYFTIYKKAVNHIWLCNCSILNLLIYDENLIFFFISVGTFWPFYVHIALKKHGQIVTMRLSNGLKKML